MATRRAAYGFGPHGLFYDVLFPHFDTNARRLATAVLGSACEQWLNAECFQAIVAQRPDVWVSPEHGKRDIVLFLPDSDPPQAGLVVESKVLYGHESPSKQRGKLRTLARQLRTAAEATDAMTVGLVTFCRFRWREGRSPWNERSWAPAKLSRQERADEGLENPFGQGARHLPVQTVRLRRFTYEVAVSLEVLRVTDGR